MTNKPKKTDLHGLIQMQAIGAVEEYKVDGSWSTSVQPHTDYQKKPLEWIEKYLGVPRNTLVWSLNEGYKEHDWDGDKDPLATTLEALANWQDVGIESATGVGKTYIAACVTLWFLACFPDSLVPTVAPKAAQLYGQVWKEIGRLWPKFKAIFPQAELLTGVLRMKPAVEDKEVWAAWAFVCGVGASEESATKAQGIHAEHVLFITEETPGIHPAIMAAIYNTRTDDHNLHLALGNPDHQLDELHKFCKDPDVLALRISADDHPNIVTDRIVVPGAIGKVRLARRKRMLKGTRLYESRIRGISPKEAEDALIRREWCEAAARKYEDEKMRAGPLWIGADVADQPTGDAAAIARGQGACCTEVQRFQVNDANDVGDRVYNEAHNPDAPVDPRYIGIDSVGVGASAVNHMRRLGLKVRHIGGGRKAVPGLDQDTLWSTTEPDLEGNLKPSGPRIIEAERFADLRTQVHWRAREDLRLGRVALPYDEELFDDLCAATWTTRNGMIVMDSKDDVRAVLGRSPNKGDAFVYGNFVRARMPKDLKASEEQMEAAGMVKSTPQRDTGLERMRERVMKRREAEDRRFQKRYGSRK